VTTTAAALAAVLLVGCGTLQANTEAIAVRVSDVTQVNGSAVAVEEWLMDSLDLADAGVHLTKPEHVMATRLGQNASPVRLDRFLHAYQTRRRPLSPRRATRDPP
jgi:hypothetical protein